MAKAKKQEPVIVVEQPEVLAPIDPADFSIKSLELNGYSSDQLLQILELEQSGKNRKSAISKIETALMEN